MLRGIRRSDVPGFTRLLLENFPEEGRLLGFRPEPLARVVSKLFRPDLRFLLGLLRLLRRPVFDLLIVEAENTVAASAILTFGPKSGYISSVVTDPAFRRRGYATRVVRALAERAARAGRPYVVLDVLDGNAPARALYAREGYATLRHVRYYAAPVATPAATGGATGIRPLRRRDLDRLAELANDLLPPPVRGVLPVGPNDLALSPLVSVGLSSESEAFVLDDGRGPRGFVRATVAETMEAAHLTQPILAGDVTPDEARALVTTALSWLASKGASRVLAEVPEANAAGAAVLTALGFSEVLGVDTLYRSSGA